METDGLITFLNAIYPLSPDLESSIREMAYRGQYKKGQIIASSGKKADEIWYLVNGLAKEYYYEPTGKTSITAFWKENDLMIIVESFFGKINSERYIELIEDSILLTIGSKQAHELRSQFPEIHSLGYSILRGVKRKSDQRSALLAMPAMESYRQFCENFPCGRISVADAASYLGMTRQTLSAIRSKK